jgi:ribonucleoside-diphosphate reductase beta chain
MNRAAKMIFAKDVLNLGIAGISEGDMRKYLEFIADQRLLCLGITPIYRSKNPFGFMELQDVQELTNFFERRVAAYQLGIEGDVSFNEEF